MDTTTSSNSPTLAHEKDQIDLLQNMLDDTSITPQPDCALLALPGEVRNVIFEFLFSSLSAQCQNAHTEPCLAIDAYFLSPSVLFCCKQLRQEALPYFFCHAAFNVIGFVDDEVGFADSLVSLEQLKNVYKTSSRTGVLLGDYGAAKEVAWAAFDPCLSSIRNSELLEEISSSESRIGLWRRPTYAQDQIDCILGHYYKQPQVNTSILFSVQLRDATADVAQSKTKHSSFREYTERADPYTGRLIAVMIRRGANLVRPWPGYMKSITSKNFNGLTTIPPRLFVKFKPV